MACGEGVVLDRETGMVSIFNIIERFQWESFPAFFPKIQIVNYLQRQKGDPKRFQATLKVVINRKELFVTNIDGNFEKKMRCRLIATIGGLAIPEPGVLKFFIHINKKQVAKYEIEVAKTTIN
jgi:hypothetical protein